MGDRNRGTPRRRQGRPTRSARAQQEWPLPDDPGVLKYLAELSRAAEGLRREQDVEPQGWERFELIRVLPAYATVVEQVVGLLIRLGLVQACWGVTYPGTARRA